MNRRTFVGVGAASLTSCSRSQGEYFGRTAPPLSSKLVCSLLAEPSTLDPAKSPGGFESYIVPALFEGLTLYHPETPEPIAGLATHYETSQRQDRFTFYLRGHAAPQGVRLPNWADLPAEFTRGRKPPVEARPACWSDGQPITAHDFVYSW